MSSSTSEQPHNEAEIQIFDEGEIVQEDAPLLESGSQQYHNLHVLSSGAPDAVVEEFMGEDRKMLKFYAKQLTLLLLPLLCSFALITWWATTLHPERNNDLGQLLFYQDDPNDSTSERLGGNIINALFFLGAIIISTFVVILCLKYEQYWFISLYVGFSFCSVLGISASVVGLLLLEAYNMPLDFLTLVFIAWNFTVVGVISIFFGGPLWLQQAYLVSVSAVLSVSFLNMPTWTIWTLLIAVAIYDYFAVLCPGGPLKILLDITVENGASLPAGLVYSAGMADRDGPRRGGIGGYRTGYARVRTEEEEEEEGTDEAIGVEEAALAMEREANRNQSEVREEDSSNTTRRGKSAQQRRRERVLAENNDEEDGLKLGLGDFLFFTLLIGLAAITSASTLLLSIIAVLTGLCATIYLLILHQTTLPALPISIFLGAIAYWGGTIWTSQMLLVLNGEGVFI